jgi:hypothetical protein
MGSKRGYIYEEDNLLIDLNHISDIIVGNDTVEDVGWGKSNLPQALAVAMMDPDNKEAIRTAMDHLTRAINAIDVLKEKLRIMMLKVDLKRKKKE